MAALRPEVVGAAFREAEPSEENESGVADGWRSKSVRRNGEQVQVIARASTVARLGEALFDQLADLTGDDRLGSSAFFCETTIPGEEKPHPLGAEHFLRKFAPVTLDNQAKYVYDWGPLVLPKEADDIWIQHCSPERHARLIFQLLATFERPYTNGTRSFVVGSSEMAEEVSAFELKEQIAVFSVYQAVIRTLTEFFLNPDSQNSLRPGFTHDDLLSSTPAPVVKIWKEQDLPTPDSVGEAVETTLALLARACSPSAPHLEICDTESQNAPYWHIERGILGAICLQAVSAVADKALARSCDYCGTLFLRRDGDSLLSHTYRAGRKFCSTKCAQASAQKAYRERKRRARQDIK